ncbi:MAG TPA: hypothetical protein ENO14_03045 [Chromatiales bacterium]|nr:hypothetical protein [Chromatiales bacterium]
MNAQRRHARESERLIARRRRFNLFTPGLNGIPGRLLRPEQIAEAGGSIRPKIASQRPVQRQVQLISRAKKQ